MIQMATRRSNHTTRIAVIFGLAIACLGLPQSAQAAEYYVAATGNDSTGTGTVSNPWRTISRVQSVLSPGDTVYCSGDFGVLDFTGYKCGTDGHWITYQAWPSMTVPTLTSLAFERAPLDYRIKFVGFTFDPGYVAESVSAVYLYGASYLIFETCHFEGAKNNAAYLAGKPYAPYSFENNTVIYTRGGDVFPTHITIRNSHLMYGCSVISPYGACHDWVIEGNEIEEFSDNGIQIRDGAYDVLIQRNNIHDGNCYKNVYSWPGTSIVSDWATHKGATVKSKKRMEDGSEVEVTGIFHNYSDGRMSVYIDNPATIPDRGSTYAWTLDGATFFTPSSGGDNDHSDGVSIEGTSHDIDVYRNTIHRITGQGIKVGEDGGASTNIRICSNLIYDTGAYSAYFISRPPRPYT